MTTATKATSTRTIATPLGDMIALASPRGLHVLEFIGAKHADAHLRTPLPSESDSARLLDAAAPADPDELLATLAEQLDGYFARERTTFAIPLAPAGTPFQRRVWRALLDIPHGQTTTYGQLAHHLGSPTATRAVANANARNPIAILIPCHRVIGQDGSLTGYAAGLDRKRQLLALERSDDTLFTNGESRIPNAATGNTDRSPTHICGTARGRCHQQIADTQRTGRYQRNESGNRRTCRCG